MPIPAIHPEDPDDDWVVEEQGRAVRVRYLTGALLVLALVGGGFWGGVVAEKHHGNGSTAASALASRFAALRTGAGAGTGATGAGNGLGGGGFGAGGGVTAGTVIDVQGDVLDLSDASGNIIKVTVGPSVPVTRSAKTTLSALQVGDTVVITGSAGDPTAVRASAPGAGGFGRAGGGGGTALGGSGG